ncbi:MAG: hypothetical protein IJR60_05205 [Eubacterium sp.]|nr:hypothetical protein [Eubacterium sp.]
MLLKNLKDKDIRKLSEIMAPKICEHRLFKFMCPEDSERQAFAQAYLRYNIPRWLERHDYILTDANFDVLIVLASPRRSSHKFHGKGAKQMKKFKSAQTVFFYRGNLSYIVHLTAPRNKRIKVMSIFADNEHDDVVFDLVDEAIALSNNRDFNLLYNTLTRRLIEQMKEKDFVVTYQKAFASTGFVQTLMMLEK